MPKKVDNVPVASNARFDWDTLLDGSIWMLTNDELGETPIQNFRAYAYTASRARGCKVHINRREDGVYIQAYSGDGE